MLMQMSKKAKKKFSIQTEVFDMYEHMYLLTETTASTRTGRGITGCLCMSLECVILVENVGDNSAVTEKANSCGERNIYSEVLHSKVRAKDYSKIS